MVFHLHLIMPIDSAMDDQLLDMTVGQQLLVDHMATMNALVDRAAGDEHAVHRQLQVYVLVLHHSCYVLAMHGRHPATGANHVLTMDVALATRAVHEWNLLRSSASRRSSIC